MSTVRELIKTDLASHFLGKKLSGSDHRAMLVTKVDIVCDPFRVELTGESPDKKAELKLESHIRRPKDQRQTISKASGIILLIASGIGMLCAYSIGYERGHRDGRELLPKEVQFGVPSPGMMAK